MTGLLVSIFFGWVSAFLCGALVSDWLARRREERLKAED